MVKSKIVAGGMLRINTPVEDYRERYGIRVKREDKSCPPPGPPFSKSRGVFKRIESRPEEVIGVLDTYHSQAGHAVARACQILGKKCVNFYPEYKNEPGWREPQQRAKDLGAILKALPAGRSCILYHRAKRETGELGGYMMPNALKLEESVEETEKEVSCTLDFDRVIIPASSGTIAAGVIRGFRMAPSVLFIVHLGYSRSEAQVRRYLVEKAGYDPGDRLFIVDEGYSYKDKARPGETPPWPCSPYYDLKAFRWLCKIREEEFKGEEILFWNIG